MSRQASTQRAGFAATVDLLLAATVVLPRVCRLCVLRFASPSCRRSPAARPLHQVAILHAETHPALPCMCCRVPRTLTAGSVGSWGQGRTLGSVWRRGGGSGAGARPGGATKGWVKGREERTRLKVRGGVSAVVPICGKRPDGARASVVAAPAAPQRHAWGAAGHSWKAECSVSGARDRGQRLAGPAAASCQCHEGGGGPTARPQRRAGWAM